MDPTLVIILAVPWLLIFLHLMLKRDFEVMLGWIFLAPIATYLIQMTPQSSLYRDGGAELRSYDKEFYLKQATNITIQEILDPTRLLVLLLFIIFVCNALLGKKRRLASDKTETWMCIFTGILLLNVLLWSGRLAFGLRVAIDAFVIPCCTYFLARRFVTTEARFHQVIRAICYMGLYVIVFCLIERVISPGMFYRIRGPFESANTLHTVLAVVFFSALLTRGRIGGRASEDLVLHPIIRQSLLWLVPIIGALTLTRGNWMGFLAGIGAFLLLARRLMNASRTIGGIGLVLLSIPMIAVGAALFVPGELVDQRITNPDNVLGRFATWIAALQLNTAPILGVGLNNLHGLLATASTKYGRFGSYSTPHNSLLSILVELGIVGLIAYSAIIITMIKRGLKLYRLGDLRQKWRGIALVGIIVAYFTPSMFANTMYVPGLIHFYVYLFAGAMAGLYTKERATVPVYSNRQPGAIPRVTNRQLPSLARLGSNGN